MESHDDFLLSGRRLYQLSISNCAKQSSQTYRSAGQRCFGLLAFISRPQVRYIYLPEQMILPGSLIPTNDPAKTEANDPTKTETNDPGKIIRFGR